MKKGQRENLPILIIGAGIAGLAAAKTLIEHQQEVMVFEARDRIGGRVYSIKNELGTFDLGASWIHGIEHNPIWDLAQQYQVSTTIFNYNESIYYHADGRPFSEPERLEFEQYVEQIEYLLAESTHENALDAAYTALNQLNYSGALFTVSELKNLLLQYFERMANDPFATNLASLAAHYDRYEGYFSGDEVIFPEGYHQIIAALAQDIKIQTQTQIQHIECTDTHVELIDQQNRRYLGCKVLIAVPLGVLKHQLIRFQPSLPNVYRQAIDTIGFGSFNKVFLEFEQPLPFEALHANEIHSYYYWHDERWFNVLDLSEIYHKPVYLMLFGGAQSEWIDQSEDQDIWQFIYSGLAANFQHIPLQPKSMLVSRWGKDPYSMGSFSFPTPEHEEELIQVLNTPVHDRMYFIGEHCSLQYAGTVHGAYLTGQAVALKLVEALKNR